MTAPQPAVYTRGQRLRHWILLLLIFLPPMFAVMPMTRFGEGMEDFNVLTAAEIQHTGNWQVPTLMGQPRLQKPPLAHWLSSLGLHIGGPVEIAARWPLAIISCLTLLVIYEWARTLTYNPSSGTSDWRAGLIAAIAAGTTIFYIRFTRRAAYDGVLMFWVTLTNLALTWIFFHSRYRRGTIVAALALGGAMLTKGPPALLQSVVPFALCCTATGIHTWRKQRQFPVRWLASNVLCLLIILTVALCALLPWILAAKSQMGGLEPLLKVWRNSMSLADEKAEGLHTSPVSGLIFFVLLGPWVVSYVGSIAVAARDWNGKGQRLLYLLTMSLLPVLLHSCMPLVRDRYLLPMMPPAAVAIGLSFLDYADRKNKPLIDRIAIIIHAVLLVAVCAGYAIASAIRPDEGIITLRQAIALTTFFAIAAATGLWFQRKSPFSIILTTLVLMICFEIFYAYDQSAQYADGRDAAMDIRTRFPGGTFYCYAGRLDPKAIAIYLQTPVHPFNDYTSIPLAPNRYCLLHPQSPTPPPPSTLVAQYTINHKRLDVWQLPY